MYGKERGRYYSRQRGREGRAGTSTSCEQSGRIRFVRSGWNAGEEGSSKQIRACSHYRSASMMQAK